MWIFEKGENKVIELNNFIGNREESDDRYICYNLNKSIMIFNCLIEGENLSDVQIYVSNNIKLESIRKEILDYIEWFSKCKNILTSYYENRLNEKVPDKWFENIEIYRVDITFVNENDYGATIYCGDTVFLDHSLEIEFEKENVIDIILNG